MIRYLLLIFLFAVSLHALSEAELLKRANSFAKSSDKTDQFRAYNDYKNLYLRALMNSDDKMRLSALEGIVESGQKLHIDVSKYAKELLHIESASTYNQPKSKANTTSKSSKKIKIKSSYKLKSLRWQNEELVLKFDKKLRNNQINYFTLFDSKRKKYKYIFDIHASMLTKSQNLRKEGIDRIKIAQYNPSTLRLVFENSKKLSVRFKKVKNSLKIKIKPSKKTKSKKSSEKVLKKKTIATPQKENFYLERDKVIVIDPGHGGKDPGALGYKRYREKVVVLQIARKLRDILRSRGFKVYMTRERDKFIKLPYRTKYANRKNADIFISIHANAVGRKNAKKVHGIECYFLSTSRSERAKKVAEMENSADLSEMDYYGKESFLSTLNSHNIVASNKLAIDLQRGALSSLKKSYKNVHDGGVREGPFWVLVGAQMPAVLVEVGFITHPTEAKRLVNREYQKKMAEGLANGVERYFINN